VRSVKIRIVDNNLLSLLIFFNWQTNAQLQYFDTCSKESVTVASDFSQDTEDTDSLITVEEKRHSLFQQRFSTYAPYSGTLIFTSLDTLLTSGSPDFPKFQTKNNAYKNPE